MRAPRFEDRPTGRRQPVALHLLTGWSFPAAALDPLVQALAPRRVTRGLPGAPLEATGPTVIGGWSLGGLHALHAACRAPARWRGCVLIAATARFCADDSGWPGKPTVALRALQRLLDRDPGQCLAGFHDLCGGAGTPAAVRSRRLADSLELGPAALAAGLRDLGRLDLRAAASACPVPVLVLHGAADRVIPVEAARAVAALLPQGRLHVHPTAGHDLPLSETTWVAARLVPFLEELT